MTYQKQYVLYMSIELIENRKYLSTSCEKNWKRWDELVTNKQQQLIRNYFEIDPIINISFFGDRSDKC